MKRKASIKNRLFWKISITFFLLLIVLGISYVFISSYTAYKYFQELNQQLYGGIAEHMVNETKPLRNGKADTTATHDIMHSMMVINPSVEVYLLDTTGRIIDYVVPYKTVKLEDIDLQPVKKFIQQKEQLYILGDDPKHPGKKNVFSAAPIYENNKLTGYAYVILAGEEQAAVISRLNESFILKLGANIFSITLIGAFIVGLLAFWFLTKNLNEIITTVRRFKEGDYHARIEGIAKNDLSILSKTFNEMADSILENIEKTKSMERLRRELIANVSHDLRTPLSIMQGYIETLIIKDESINSQEKNKYLNIILDSSKKLSHLVYQLFEYSKLEANQVEPEKEPFFINELASDIVMKYDILAKEKEIKLQVDSPSQLPLVFADVGLVERVIQNLLDNALKFTPQNGNVTIKLSNQKNGVEVCVSDTGQGIPEQEQHYIFERYRKSSNIEKSSNKGSGLGLAIAKKILELHNSVIYIKSAPDIGTSFWFLLPAHQA